MNVKHLRYFVAVAEQGSIAAAARRLNVSASPLSRRLRELEVNVGTTLFDRRGAGMELTDEGRRVLNLARRIVGLADDIRAVGSGGAPASATISVGLRSVHPRLRRLLLDSIREARPQQRLTVRPMVPAEQVAGLLEGTLDLGTVRSTPAEADIACLPLLMEELGFAVPDRPPFSERLEIGLSDVAGLRLIMHHAPLHPVLDDFARTAVRVQPELSVSGGSAALIAQGDHFTMVPTDRDSSARRAVDEPGVLIRRVAGGPYTFTTYLAWRRDRGTGDLADLVAALGSVFSRPDTI